MQNSFLDNNLASWKVLVFAEMYLKAFLYIENMLSKVVSVYKLLYPDVGEVG